MKDKFDFDVANSLIEVIEVTVNDLENKNEVMMNQFVSLNENFKDSGYDTIALDMSVADKAIKDVMEQLREVSKSIKNYAQRLEEVR